MSDLPKYYKIVSGIGKDKYPLVSFDKALINAGISDFNLVKISSILPAHCRQKDIIDLPKGSILYAAYATKTVTIEQVATGVSISFSNDVDDCAIIYEASGNFDRDTIKEMVCDMGSRALSARNRKLVSQISSCIDNVNTPNSENDYTTIISAVVLW